MKVELIPVIDLTNYSHNVTLSELEPYWENPDVWQNYREKCYLKLGFKDKFIPYYKGSGFYRPKDISDDNLIKIIEDRLNKFSPEYLKADFQNKCFDLYGGYVLKINNQDILFPQCCSLIADWQEWGSLIKGKSYDGYIVDYGISHPAPKIECVDQKVIFNCSDKYKEFSPPPTKEKIVVDLADLEIAYDKMILELKELETRLLGLSKKINYPVDNEQLIKIISFNLD